jgi:hypothetical protein
MVSYHKILKIILLVLLKLFLNIVMVQDIKVQELIQFHIKIHYYILEEIILQLLL